MSDVTNGQRAMWMVLITSLAAPFFVSLADLALVLSSPLFDFILPAKQDRSVGEAAIGAFVWASFPATVGALGLVPYVLQSGTYSWLHAAVAGVVAFGAAAIIWPIGSGSAMPFLAFIAGIAAIGMRALLMHGGILKP